MTDNTLEHLKAEMDAAWAVYEAAWDDAHDKAAFAPNDTCDALDKACTDYYKAEDAYYSALGESND